MTPIKNIVITCAVLALCEAYSVGKPKCNFDDGECQSKLYSGVIQQIAGNGISDLGIPPIDPYLIKDLDFLLLGLINLTIVDGKAVGIKNCICKDYRTDVKNLRTNFDYECETLHVEGHYTATTLPSLNVLLGDIKIHGDGDFKVDINKLLFHFEFAYEIVKLDDGELHLHLNPQESKYTFEILGGATFDANKLFVGTQDISSVGIAVVNENWQYFSKIFGMNIVDKSLEIFYDIANRLFKGVPAKDFYIDDLSSYVKN